MRILIVRPWAHVGYGNSYNVQGIGLAKALIRRGHQCDLVYFNGKDANKVEFYHFDGDKQIKIVLLKGLGIAGNGMFFGLRKMLSEYDIIQTSEYEQWTSWYLYTYFSHKTVLYHGPYYSAFKKKYNLKCEFTDRILLPLTKKENVTAIAKSNLAKEFLQTKGINNITTIGVGLDTDRFTIEHKENQVIWDLKRNKGPKRYLLYIGLIEDRRHVDLIVDVFCMIHAVNSAIELILVGKQQRRYGETIFERIRTLKLEDYVHYIEKLEQHHIGDLYKICDLFIFPSQYEIFGMVLLEAMYFGLPVISSCNGGSATLIKDGYNGYILQDFNTKSWADAALDILKRGNIVGNNAQTTITENFTWDHLADRFIEVYKNKLKMKRSMKLEE